MSAHMVRAGIEPAVVYPNGNRVFYLAQGTETAGTFGLDRWEFVGLAEGIGDFDEDAYAAFMREHDNHWL